MAGLTPRERAVLDALERARPRVLSREALAAAAGLDGLSARRVDALLTGVRRAIGESAVVTVRGRGWRLVTPDERAERA